MTGRLAQRTRDLLPLIAMFALFFLVVSAVGILRPIRNSLALDGLADTQFYKVYLVSGLVVFFVPVYNRLAARFPWRWLIPSVAAFFALNLILFRFAYVEGSAAFGLVFYGWYDLFAAALVTQFFMATQLFLDARAARRAYPIVIAGGSLGATLGSLITGFFAERLGTPNLLLVAAAPILVFAVGMPLVWRAGERLEAARPKPRITKISGGELRELLKNPHVRLIASLVLTTVVVKQLVDYQFNTLTEETFVERDAITAFQGKFRAATDWLPVVVLAALQPALRRFGIGAAVFLLPVAMLFANLGLVLFWGVWTAAFAKVGENTVRYSAERTGREILYVPIPEDVKLRAKAYIDVALEKGIGKVASGLLIPFLLLFMNYRWTSLVGMGLCVLWLFLAFRARAEYTRTLAQSIEGRFASLRGAFASLLDANTMPLVRQALGDGDPRRAAFAMDLVAQSSVADTRALAPELRSLLAHESDEVRARALEVLQRAPAPEDWPAIRERLQDPVESVREAAVRALFAKRVEPGALVEQLLTSPEPVVRTAVLACVARGELDGDALAVARRVYAKRMAGLTPADVETRCELALAAGALADGNAHDLLTTFLDDPDARVVSTALRSAGMTRAPELYPRLLQGLGRAGTREAARDALARLGPTVVPYLGERLMDPATDPAVRRALPSVLARIPSQSTVEALIQLFLAPETDQVLDYRTMKALSSLRARHPALAFDAGLIERPIAREAGAAARYAEARSALPESAEGVSALLRSALLESWRERRETTFRALGLVHPQEETYRCYLALGGTQSLSRANALEWLENRTGYQAFQQLAPVLAEPGSPAAGATRANGSGALDRLSNDDDPWIALLARNVHTDPTLGSNGMDTIEKVFLLQKVDLLREARSAHLAILASIAEELEVPAGTRVLREGEPTDALYVVVKGAVELRGMGGTLLANDGAAFGTWALIDQSPSVVEAKTRDQSRLLRITRDDFQDLVADHPELAIGMLQGLAKRMRTIVS
jgi:ATP/ADP translocase/HEAT repeat protein